MPQLQKTNAMRMLERAGIPYKPVYYEIADEEFCGEAVSQLTGIPPEQSFKTLCAKGDKRGVLVFVIPVDGELDLKAAAVAAQDKRVELVHVKELITLTGYVRGGVSPVGMKKLYPTYFDETRAAVRRNRRQRRHKRLHAAGGTADAHRLARCTDRPAYAITTDKILRNATITTTLFYRRFYI